MGCPQVTYTTLLDGYVKAGDLEGARLLWLDMRQSNVLPNAATFNTLLTGLAASPEPESMKVRFNGLLAINVLPSFAGILLEALQKATLTLVALR